MNKSGFVLIELNLYAVGHYSGAEYNEVVFITPQDFVKYFGSGQDTDAETFDEYVKELWDGRELSVGELDGKHSEVYGEVEVDFWDANRIAEYWEQPSNDGEILLDAIVYGAMGNSITFDDRQKFIDTINKNVDDLVTNIGTKVTVECRVPKDKVEELHRFVEQLNKK